MLLSRFCQDFVRRRKDKKFRSLEVRRKLIALKKKSSQIILADKKGELWTFGVNSSEKNPPC